VAGRFFTDAEDRAGGDPVAVMSYSWWQRRFGRDWSVLERTVTVGAAFYKIIGVEDATHRGRGEREKDPAEPTDHVDATLTV
jgi:hypothetical protein